MLKLSSHPNSIHQIELFVNELFEEYQIAPQRRGDIMISLTEAVNNAIIHGNDSEPDKMVEVHSECCGEYLDFVVSDEGEGFDYTAVPDPTAPENLCKCGGRGVFLMRELSDDISFNDNGSTVRISFQI